MTTASKPVPADTLRWALEHPMDFTHGVGVAFRGDLALHYARLGDELTALRLLRGAMDNVAVIVEPGLRERAERVWYEVKDTVFEILAAHKAAAPSA